jgi:putative addiction module component (TIGR02574 family)
MGVTSFGPVETMPCPSSIGYRGSRCHCGMSPLWDSLERDDLPVTAAQAAELDRRMATYEQDKLSAQPWNCSEEAYRAQFALKWSVILTEAAERISMQRSSGTRAK